MHHFKKWLRENLSDSTIRYLKNVRSIVSRCIYEFSELYLTKNVSFIIVGAQKSGTTALWHFLGEHPDVSLGKSKETNFFSVERVMSEASFRKAYHREFKPFPDGKLLGEASPRYMLKSHISARQIARYNPNIKLIFILRNPIDRAYSEYIMHRDKYRLRIPFEKCLQMAKEDVVLNKKSRFSNKTIKMKEYIEYGEYAKQIKTFLEFFDKKQMLFLRTEELQNNHKETMLRVYEFLGLNPFTTKPRIIHSHDYEPMSSHAREILQKEYYDSIIELERLLCWDLSEWKQ